MRARTSGRDRDARAEIGAEEAQATVVRGGSAPGRGLPRRRGTRGRARRPHSERCRSTAPDRERARPQILERVEARPGLVQDGQKVVVVESLGGADRIDAGVRPPSPHEGKEILQMTSGGIEGRQHADIAVQFRVPG